MASNHSTLTASSARAPFDDEDADIVFRSSDNVNFRLYKVVIAKVSPIMRDMLTVPPGPSADAAAPQVVQLTETARTLEFVFRLCGPVERPDITTCDDVCAVLEAARKYDMAAVIANLRCDIRRILPEEPLRLYAIAYMYELEDVARDAAKLLLDDPSFYIPSPPPPEFRDLPCLAIYSVHKYRERCVPAALSVLKNHDWSLAGDHERARLTASDGGPWNAWCWYASSKSSSGHNGQCTASSIITVYRVGHWWPVQQWWISYVDSIRSALASRPSGRTIREHLGDPSGSEALVPAFSCTRCRGKIYSDLSLFNSLLAARVDEAVGQVDIELPFARAT